MHLKLIPVAGQLHLNKMEEKIIALLSLPGSP